MAARLHRALVASRSGTGVVVWTDSKEFDTILLDVNTLDDLGLTEAPDGLSVWTGHIRMIWTGHNSQDDFVLEGDFRSMNEDEYVAVTQNKNPWIKRRATKHGQEEQLED